MTRSSSPHIRFLFPPIRKVLEARVLVHPPTSLNAFKHNMVPNLRPTLVGRPRPKLKRPSRPAYDGRKPPRLQPSVDPDHRVATPEKNDIDRKAHEEHVHPHKRGEAAVVEEHS